MKKSKIKYLYRWLGVMFLGWLLIYKFNFKDTLIYSFEGLLPANEVAVLEAMVFGNSRGLNQDFYNQLIGSGLIHIMVASGSNMMIVVKGIVEGLAPFLGRKTAIVVSLLFGWIYADMVGWQIPIIRAGCVVTIMYFGQIVGRKYSWIRGLILAGVIMILASPKSVLEISFWLSFVSFAAVSFKLNEGVIKTSLRVMLWLSPLLAFRFGQISLVSPLSNLLVLFLTETIMTWGILAAILATVWRSGGMIILWLIYPFLVYIEIVSKLFSMIPMAVLKVEINIVMMIGIYMLMIARYLKKR